MKKIFSIVMITFVTALYVSAQCSDADKAALKQFDKDWSKAGQSGDRAALTAIYADEFVGFPDMETKSSAIESTLRQAEADKANPSAADKVVYDHYMISCTPTTATVTHRNTVTTQSGAGGKPETFYTRSVHFLEKRNGKWQVVSNAGHSLDDYMTLGYMELDWIEAVKSRNMEWFDKNYAADFSEVSFMTGGVSNKKQSMDSLRADKTVFDDLSISDLNIRIDRNTAIITGIGRAKGKDSEGRPFDMKARFTDVYIKRDGRWQAWSSSGTPIPSAPTVTAKN